MPKVVAQFKCIECLDVFEATSEEFSECKCGKCCVKPSESTTSYKNKTSTDRGCYFERLESKTYRYQEDYHYPQKEFFDIWNMIKEKKESRGYESPSMWIYERTDKSADGNEFLSSLSVEVYDVNNSSESTSLKFNVDLKRKQDDEELLSRVKKFYELFMKIVNKEIDINDRTVMKENSEDWYRKQCELYDYTFYA